MEDRPTPRTSMRADEHARARHLIVASGAIMAILLIGTVGYYLIFPGTRLIDCAYMTVITVSTVGYREVLPIESFGAKLLTIVLILVGISTLTYGAMSLVAFVIEGQLRDVLRRKRLLKSIRKLRDHYIVCGLGRVGLHAVNELVQTRRPFVVVESDAARIASAFGHLGPFLYVLGDAQDDEVLAEAGIEYARGLVAVLGSDKQNLALVVSARYFRKDLDIVARCVVADQEQKLLRTGARRAVLTNRIGGYRMAAELVRPEEAAFLDLMTLDVSRAVRIEDVVVEPGSHLDGRRLADSGIRDIDDILVIAVKKRDGSEFAAPNPDDRIGEGDVFILLGNVAGVKQLQRIAGA